MMSRSVLMDARTGEVTVTEYDDGIPEPTPDEIIAEQRANRQAAYRLSSDPLFFKWQAGEAEREEWEAARDAVRARYPYPE